MNRTVIGACWRCGSRIGEFSPRVVAGGPSSSFRSDASYPRPLHRYAEFQRALKNGNLWVAEAVARELPRVPLEGALRLVNLSSVKESPKFERAAMRFLRCYVAEKEPTLKNFAKVVRDLDGRRGD